MPSRPRRRTDADGDELESALAIKVEHLLDLYGWRWFHAPDNRPIQAASGRTYVQVVRRGFPDYIALRGPELLVIELKRERGRLGPGQAEWLEAWRTFAGALELTVTTANDAKRLTRDEVPAWPVAEVYIWRPSDLEAINARLSRGRHRLEPVG